MHFKDKTEILLVNDLLIEIHSKLFRHKNDGTVREFDFARKSVEDPLLLLKQKESEKFKQLKANPQKMARLQKLMKAYLGQDEEGENSDK